MNDARHELSVVAGGGDPGWGTAIAKDARAAGVNAPGYSCSPASDLRS